MQINNNVHMAPMTLNTTSTAATKPSEDGESFASVLKRKSHEDVVQGATSAQGAIPGQPTMALAVRGPMVAPAIGVPAPIGSTAAEGPGTTSSSAGGTSAASIQSAMQQSQDQSMQMLAIQQQMSAQSLQFTTASNVQRAQADTAKAVSQNIHS
jgi:hypothetical protein